MSKCIGCGVKIQTQNPDMIGFVPELIVIENGEEVYCKRCHDIRHHNKEYQRENNLQKYYDLIAIIKKQKALVVLIIDVLDIYSGFIANLKDYIGNNEVLIVINKIDIMPKGVKLHRIKEEVLKIANQEGLNVTDCLLISAKKKGDVIGVIEKINSLKYYNRGHYQKVKFNDCYIIGTASVGKSTFINTMLSHVFKENNRLTTSDQFQTTVDFIKIPIDDKSYIIDTPGIVNTKSVNCYLDYQSVKLLTPKTYLKVRTFQLNAEQTIFLGGLAQLNFIKGQKISVSAFVANELYIHRCKYENAADLFQNQLTNILKPPLSFKEPINEQPRIKHLIKLDHFEENNVYDLIISGIGFLHLTGENVEIELILPKNIQYKLVKTFI